MIHIANSHSFLAPRPNQRHIFDCLTCDGVMMSSPAVGMQWRDAPDKPWRPYPNGAPCPNTRDRKAEARQKMIDDFRAAPRTGPWDDA